MKKYLLSSWLITGIVLLPLLVHEENVTYANDEVDVEALAEEVEELREIVNEMMEILEELMEDNTSDSDVEESANDEGNNDEDELAEEREAPQTDGDGTRNNPYSIDDIAEFEVNTYSDDWEDLEGLGSLEIDEFLRGDSAVNFMTENYHREPDDAPEGLEWSIISFNFKWLESEDENSMYLSSSDFEIFSLDGSRIRESGIYGHFENQFSIDEIYAGGSTSGKFSVLVPQGEEFNVRFGDDLYIDYIFYTFDEEK